MRFLARLLVALALLAAPATAQVTRVYLTSGTTWTVPMDWNSQNNTVEIIGAGGIAEVIGANDNGGGGGAYSKGVNIPLAPGSTANIHFGGPSDSGVSDYVWFGSLTMVRAESGWNGNGGFCNGCGGRASQSIGSVKYDGGSGGAGSGGGTGAGGAGGAAGPNGAGGSSVGPNSAGGSGGPGGGGAAGTFGGGAGGNGTEWDATHGSGGGGGGDSVSQRMGAGGNYGGGSAVVGGVSKGGLIVITYIPRHRVSSGVF